MALSPAQIAAGKKLKSSLPYQGSYFKPVSTPTTLKTAPTAPTPTTPKTATSTYTAPKATTTAAPGVSTPVVEQEKPSWIGDGTQSSSGMSDSNSLISGYADEQTKNLLQSLRSAYDQNRTDLYAQKPMIQQEASGMRNSADTSYYQTLPELYKAMESGGQRGGENITGMVGLNTVRGQGRNNADLYETNQLRNIENAVTSLGSQQSQAEAEARAGIGSDTFSARLQAMRDAVSQADKARETEKSDFTNTIGAYSDNYMQEINNLKSQGVPDTDYRILALRAARNDKIANQNASAYETSQDAEANALAWARLNKTGSSDSTLSYENALIAYNAGDRTDAVLKALGLL